MRTVRAAILLLTGMLLSGCFSDSTSEGEASIGPTDPTSGNGAPPAAVATGFRALFVPLNGVLPYPNDLYFSGTADATLNFPSTPFFPATVLLPNGTKQPVINALDGFSTQAPMKVRFSSAIDPASITPGAIVIVEVLTDPKLNKAPVGVRRGLVPGVDFSAALAPNLDAGGALLQLTPLKPLASNNDPLAARDIGYLVIVTNAVRSTTGAPAVPDTDYANIKAAQPTCAAITNPTLNGVCRITGAQLQIAQAVGVNPANIILTFSFTTESVSTTLSVLSQQVLTSPPPPTAVLPVAVASTGTILAPLFGPAARNLANIYVATITVPYYLTAPIPPASGGNGREPLEKFWRAAAAPPAPLADPLLERNLTRFNPVPAKTQDLTVPVLISVPRSPALKPANGWPVVVYQHGITTNRATMVLMADAVAAAGFAMVAMDLPLHGITPDDPFYALSPTNPANAALPAPFRVGEPTFNVDYVNNTTGAAGPDGQPDASGAYFINLTSLLTGRDNLRQAVSNLINLTRAAPSMDLDGIPATVDFDATRMHFFGWSLGGIIGSAFMGTPGASPLRAVTLFAAGCGVLETLRQSTRYSTILNNGLAAAGVPTGSSLYWEYVHAAQAVVEAGDGCNYTASWGSRPIHMMEIAGTPGDATRPSDLAVPNSSTERLAALLGVPVVTATVNNPAGALGLVKLTEGGHGTISVPAPAPQTLNSYIEAQTELQVFLQTDGSTILVSNPGIVTP